MTAMKTNTQNQFAVSQSMTFLLPVFRHASSPRGEDGAATKLHCDGFRIAAPVA